MADAEVIYKDWGSSGESKVVSSKMSEGRMELAMEETKERKRDESESGGHLVRSSRASPTR